MSKRVKKERLPKDKRCGFVFSGFPAHWEAALKRKRKQTYFIY